MTLFGIRDRLSRPFLVPHAFFSSMRVLAPFHPLWSLLKTMGGPFWTVRALITMEYSDHGHLAIIARRIAELERHIEYQRQILVDLEKVRRGDSKIAEIVRSTLRAFELNLEREIRDQKRTTARMHG